MDIIVIGGGAVGTSICSQLAKEGHDITVIDSKSAPLLELSNTCDVFTLQGNGADISLLKRAGAEKADLLIAVTSGDEVNILSCSAAKKLGTRHTIARVRNPEYSGLVQLMKSEMNLSLTINPELTAAKEVYRTLRFPAAAKIDTFSRGRVELAQLTVYDNSPICGSTLIELRSKLNIRFLICSVLRGNVAFIPNGSFVIQPKDIICITAPDDEITELFKAIGAYKQPVRDVMICGGGRTTYYLEAMLQKGNINSTVIERDKNLCHELAEQYSCTVLNGNGTDQQLLMEEGIDKVDAFLALSDVDEENAIMSMYAKNLGVSKVVTLISTMSYIDFFKSVGLDTIVSPKSSTTAYILRYVRSMTNVRDSEIESLHKFMEDKVEALEFSVKSDIEDVTDVPLKNLRLRPDTLIACIVHRDKIIIPTGNDVITKGDTVIVVTSGAIIDSIRDVIT